MICIESAIALQRVGRCKSIEISICQPRSITNRILKLSLQLNISGNVWGCILVEWVIDDHHLFILETPLFRVRNKKDTYYCYNEAERVDAIKQCGRNPEITRFKGLGEISPAEFKEFVGAEMKLTPVDASSDPAINETINFYMGRNTPDRKAYIMSNLIVDAEST